MATSSLSTHLTLISSSKFNNSSKTLITLYLPVKNMESMLSEDEHCVLPGPGSEDSIRAAAKTSPVILPVVVRGIDMYAARLEFEMHLRRSYVPPRYIGDDGLGKENYTSEKMNQLAEDFLGYTHFEKLYRGKIKDQVVVVKICNIDCNVWKIGIDWILRIIDEIKFLEDPSMKGHPNLVNIVGYCEEGLVMGVVYDLDPLDTLTNLISKGSLNWNQTIEIALEVAQLVAWLHGCGYFVRNLAPDHIIIDKNFKPRLVDFMMLTGGVMGDRISREGGIRNIPPGYWAPGDFGQAHDVYVYGKILINLIAKKIYDLDVSDDRDRFIADVWAKEKYNNRGSLLHESLQKEIDDTTGKKIMELAMCCIVDEEDQCPKMEEVVKTLLKIKWSGEIHVNSILKRVYDKDVPYCDQFHADLWAEEEYNNRGVRSFVHESLLKEIDDDSTEKKITKLAMDCFVVIGDDCLTMEQVVATLLEIIAC